MTQYAYWGRDRMGNAVRGVLEMPSREATAEHLEQIGLLPIAIEEDRGAMLQRRVTRRLRRLRGRELAFFTRQLSTLERAGVPLLQALLTVREQSDQRFLQELVRELTAAVEQGRPLSEALEERGGDFSDAYVQAVRAGETSGRLGDILLWLAELAEHEQEVRGRIRSASFYPCLVCCMILFAIVFLATFVLPRFATFFVTAGVDLLLFTKMMLWLGQALRAHWLVISIGTVLAVWGAVLAVRSRWGRPLWDRALWHLPIVRRLVREMTFSRFARMLSVLTRSGVPIIGALGIAGDGSGNSLVRSAIGRVRGKVAEGQGIAGPLREERLFPPILVRMVAVGEETGQLPNLLTNIADHYDFEVNELIRRVTVLVEPVLLLLMGLVVFGVIFSIFIPLLKFYSNVAGGAAF